MGRALALWSPHRFRSDDEGDSDVGVHPSGRCQRGSRRTWAAIQVSVAWARTSVWIRIDRSCRYERVRVLAWAPILRIREISLPNPVGARKEQEADDERAR